MKRLIQAAIITCTTFFSLKIQAQNVDYVGSTLWSGMHDVKIVGDFAYCALEFDNRRGFAAWRLQLDMAWPINCERRRRFVRGPDRTRASALSQRNAESRPANSLLEFGQNICERTARFVTSRLDREAVLEVLAQLMIGDEQAEDLLSLLRFQRFELCDQISRAHVRHLPEV